MRTRPPKHIRASTADVYRELSGLLTEAGCAPLPTVVGNLSRETGPSFRETPIADAFGSFADVRERIERLRNHRAPRTVDADGWLVHRAMFGRLHLAADEPPVVFYSAPGDWTPKPPPPLALNLNVSADVPTLETMCHT